MATHRPEDSAGRISSGSSASQPPKKTMAWTISPLTGPPSGLRRRRRLSVLRP
jgi:hypothetical protein